MNPILLVLAVLVGLIVYGNIAWAYMYVTLGKRGWLYKFLACKSKDGGDAISDWLHCCLSLIWPLAIAITTIWWFLWLVCGGIARTLVGKDVDGNPLKPATPPSGNGGLT